MNKKIIDNLIAFGLSDTEARVYCAGLALDDASVDRIAKRSGVNRTACYPVLERLLAMGLMGRAKTRGKSVFKSVPPERLLRVLDDKRDAVQAVLPDLRSLFEISRGRPEVSYFEGREGLKTVLNDILAEAKELCVFGDAESFVKAIPGWTESYIEKRAKKRIAVKMVLRGTPYAIRSLKIGSGLNVPGLQVRLLPVAYRIDSAGFDLYGNKVALYTFGKQGNAVVVKDFLISQMMRTAFDILWETAGKYQNRPAT